MSEDGHGSKGRRALGDVTNRPLKRGLSMILDDASSKPRDGKGKSRATGKGDSGFTDRVSSGVENLLQGQLGDKDIGVGVEKIVPLTQAATNEVVPIISDTKQDAEAPHFSGPTTQSLEGLEGRLPDEVAQSGDKECQEERVDPVATEDSVQGDSISHGLNHADKDVGVGKLASNKFGSIEWSRLPINSQTGSFELEACKLLKGCGTHNTSQGTDLLISCSCSFCLKAAYIWSDLHYQDVKGRITALRKSQKEAAALVHKTGKGKEIEAIGPRGSTSKPTELETNLFNQWKSLFLHMEGVLGQEGNQLQANYIALRDLRENCKMDLEVINRMPLNKD